MSKKLAAMACFVGLMILGGLGLLELTNEEANARTVASSRTLRLEVDSEKPDAAVLKETVLRLKLTDSQGRPVTGATAEAYLVMPNMFCGRIPVEVEETSNGEFRLAGVPVMRGKWQATITVAYGDDEIQAEHRFNTV